MKRIKRFFWLKKNRFLIRRNTGLLMKNKLTEMVFISRWWSWSYLNICILLREKWLNIELLIMLSSWKCIFFYLIMNSWLIFTKLCKVEQDSVYTERDQTSNIIIFTKYKINIKFHLLLFVFQITNCSKGGQ